MMRWVYYIFEGECLIQCMDVKELGKGRLFYHLVDGSSGFAEKGCWKREWRDTKTIADLELAFSKRRTAQLVDFNFRQCAKAVSNS